MGVVIAFFALFLGFQRRYNIFCGSVWSWFSRAFAAGLLAFAALIRASMCSHCTHPPSHSTYCPAAGMVAALACPAGYACSTTGITVLDNFICAAGYYCTLGVTTVGGVVCPAGSICPGTGAVAATPCFTGYVKQACACIFCGHALLCFGTVLLGFFDLPLCNAFWLSLPSSRVKRFHCTNMDNDFQRLPL